MNKLADLKAALMQLNREFPRPGLENLTFSEPYLIARDWPRLPWPGASCPGIYAFLNDADDVLYIGKASCTRNLGRRLGWYFTGRSPGSSFVANDNARGAAAVVTLSLPPERAFEVPAIEEFLLERVATVRNQNGVRRHRRRDGA